jgi:hypothetical protein
MVRMASADIEGVFRTSHRAAVRHGIDARRAHALHIFLQQAIDDDRVRRPTCRSPFVKLGLGNLELEFPLVRIDLDCIALAKLRQIPRSPRARGLT